MWNDGSDTDETYRAARRTRLDRRSVLTGVVALGAAVVAREAAARSGAVPLGQGATPAAGGEAATRRFLVTLHQGTCAQLGAVVAPLRELGDDDPNPGIAIPGTVGVERVQLAGPSTAVPAWQSSSGIAVPFDALLAAPHAITVAAAETPDRLVACGDVGGRLIGQNLLFGLPEVNGSGLAGVAILGRQDAETNALVVLAPVSRDAA